MRKLANNLFIWVNVEHIASKRWKDATIKTQKQVNSVGMYTGLKTLYGRGPQFIIVHAERICA